MRTVGSRDETVTLIVQTYLKIQVVSLNVDRATITMKILIR